MVRVLLSSSTGYLGKELLAAFAAHEVVEANWENDEELTKVILEGTDVIVVDLNLDSHRANAVLNVLSKATLEEPKTILGVSSVLTWNETKTKKNKPLTEADYKNRKCTPRFKELKLMETLVLNAKKENLNAIVVAPGVMYGFGEDSLATIFRDAWMCEANLSVMGEGTNSLPVIHVKDAATFIEKVASAPPEKSYLVAFDNSELTQKSLLNVISMGLGTGVVSTCVDSEAVLMEESDVAQVLSSAIKFDKESLHLTTITDMEWHNDNFTDGFLKVRTEFSVMRKLTPMRVSVIGPPGAGKSLYAQKLSERYCVPVVQVGDVIEEALKAGDELAEQAKAMLEEQNASITAKGGKGKKKPAPKKGKGKAKPEERSRLPASMVATMLKRKLLSSACRNKGFILDGYPRTGEEASTLFAIKTEGEDAPPAEGEEASEEKEVVIDTTIMVQFVVSIEAVKEEAELRLQGMKEELVIVGHNDEGGFQRRWDNYEYVMDDKKPEGPFEPLPFFTMVEALEVPSNIAASFDEGFSAMTKYVEVGGKPFNFHPTPAEVAVALELADKERRESKAKAAATAKEQEEEEKRLRLAQEESDNMRKNYVLEEDQQMVEAACLPLRKYLMRHVIPQLTDGLLDVCQTQPQDPIDYLAEYLFKHAMLVPSS